MRPRAHSECALITNDARALPDHTGDRCREGNSALVEPAGALGRDHREQIGWLVCDVNFPARAPDGGLIASSVVLPTRVLRSVMPRPRMPQPWRAAGSCRSSARRR